MGRGAVMLDGAVLRLTVGRRLDVTVPVASIARAFAPTFRDLPTPGTNQGRDYLNPTKPAAPNVLVELRESRPVRLMGGVRREVRRIALHLDDPAGFLAALAETKAATVPT